MKQDLKDAVTGLVKLDSIVTGCVLVAACFVIPHLRYLGIGLLISLPLIYWFVAKGSMSSEPLRLAVRTFFLCLMFVCAFFYTLSVIGLWVTIVFYDGDVLKMSEPFFSIVRFVADEFYGRVNGPLLFFMSAIIGFLSCMILALSDPKTGVGYFDLWARDSNYWKDLPKVYIHHHQRVVAIVFLYGITILVVPFVIGAVVALILEGSRFFEVGNVVSAPKILSLVTTVLTVVMLYSKFFGKDKVK